MKYVLDLLEDLGMMGCELCSTPIESDYQFKEDDSERLIDAGIYQWLVSRIIYLSLTRPSITYVGSVISLFIHTLTQTLYGSIKQNSKVFKGLFRESSFLYET